MLTISTDTLLSIIPVQFCFSVSLLTSWWQWQRVNNSGSFLWKLLLFIAVAFYSGYFTWKLHPLTICQKFLGGLRFHLDTLYSSSCKFLISHWGHLLPGFLSYLNTRGTKAFAVTSFGQFWKMAIYDKSRDILVFLTETTLSESPTFLNEGLMKASLNWGLNYRVKCGRGTRTAKFKSLFEEILLFASLWTWDLLKPFVIYLHHYTCDGITDKAELLKWTYSSFWFVFTKKEIVTI